MRRLLSLFALSQAKRSLVVGVTTEAYDGLMTKFYYDQNGYGD
jgi:hypothetical protein